jgi:stress-induced morphogen
MSDASPSFPVAAFIRDKLTEAFSPSHLEVINESHMHNV